MKNFFKGISFSSICAGALAAVTSFLLSAKIGIAGSVIGVAAGSIVSAVATQVYKNVLKASGEKLQNAVPFVTNDKDGTDGAGKSGDDATTVIAPAESEGEQTKTLSAEESDETTVMTSVDGDTTAAMPATSGRVISSAQAGGRESNILPDNAGGSIQHAGRRASFDAWLHGKRAPIVIAIVTGSAVGILSVALIARWMGAEPAVVASLEPKSVTTAIALSLSANSGGIPALTSVVVIVVGVFGGIVGPWVLRKVGVESRIAKGLAMGAAAHAMGTARAMELGAVEGAISGLAIGLMGVATAVLVPILEKII